MPEQDAVIAITSGVGPMQPVLDLVWQHLLPALGAAALPADEAGRAALAQKLAGLAIRPPQGQGAPALAAEVSGRTYNFAANDVRIESIGFSFGADGCAMTIRDERGDHRIVFGDRAWRTGSTLFVDRGLEQPIVAAGAWTGDDTYVARMYYTETPFCVTMTSRFAGERVWFDFALNVAFVPTTFPQIEGRAEAQPS